MKTKEANAVELVETTPLEGLGRLATEDVYAHVECLGRELPGPVDLYQRWERQQWSATDLDPSVDREQWSGLNPALKEQLEGTFTGLVYGEQAVTDTLSPLVMGAPDEENRLFLSTQLVDEARHSYFFARVFNVVLGVPGGLKETLAYVGGLRDSGTGYGRIFDPQNGELVTLTEAVRLGSGQLRQVGAGDHGVPPDGGKPAGAAGPAPDPADAARGRPATGVPSWVHRGHAGRVAARQLRHLGTAPSGAVGAGFGHQDGGRPAVRRGSRCSSTISRTRSGRSVRYP